MHSIWKVLEKVIEKVLQLLNNNWPKRQVSHDLFITSKKINNINEQSKIDFKNIQFLPTITFSLLEVMQK